MLSRDIHAMENRISPDPQLDNPTGIALELIALSEGTFPMHASGTSMLPLIQLGDKIVVEHEKGYLSPGTIVVYRQGDHLISHRLLRVLSSSGEMMQTMGDNALRPDPVVQAKLVHGRVTGVRRGTR